MDVGTQGSVQHYALATRACQTRSRVRSTVTGQVCGMIALCTGNTCCSHIGNFCHALFCLEYGIQPDTQLLLDTILGGGAGAFKKPFASSCTQGHCMQCWQRKRRIQFGMPSAAGPPVGQRTKHSQTSGPFECLTTST